MRAGKPEKGRKTKWACIWRIRCPDGHSREVNVVKRAAEMVVGKVLEAFKKFFPAIYQLQPRRF
jgi:hypothetical protein